MGLVLDASTPIRWTGIDAGGNVTSASFTAPANSLLVLTGQWDTANNTELDATVVSDTGGLAWTQQIVRGGASTTAGGGSGIWTASPTTSASRTVTLKYTALGAGAGTKRISCKLYVWTGQDTTTPVDTTGASNSGGSSTNNLTTSSVTPGADGVLLVSDCDWNELGVETSSDLTIDSADYASQISVASGYKTCSSGVAVTANLNAGGTAAAQHKWCQIVVRAASGGGGGPVVQQMLSLLGCGA